MRRALPSLVAALLALAVGCGNAAAPEGTPDEAVMAALGTVRALHHEADVFESAGDLERASQAIRRVIALDFPRGMVEAEDLRADAYGRLAELSLRRGAADECLSLASTGVSDARRESVLKARLFMVRGQCLGALADRAQQSGDARGAAQRRDEALQALETSIEMNQRVLRRITDGGQR